MATMSIANALLSLPPHFAIYMVSYTFFSQQSSGGVGENILCYVVGWCIFLDAGLTVSNYSLALFQDAKLQAKENKWIHISNLFHGET